MTRIPEIIPVTDLRQDAAEVLARVRESRQPFIITQRGRAAAVLVSVEEYEKQTEELEILRLLARGEKDIAEGKVHDLSSVMEDVDKLLSADQD